MKTKKTLPLLALMGILATLNGTAQVRNDNEANFPEEGTIVEATWGGYLLGNPTAAERKVRLGVSNDGYTKAEIQFWNHNTSHGHINFKTANIWNLPALTRMTIRSNGNVGIGTETPGEKLAVNGNIRAKEVKVEIANWPDYVFQPGYPLMPLPKLRTYIEENGHLPGIPTASEVEAEGIALAEMNRKLLEKVEELTVHLIRLNAKNDDLERQVYNLTEEIKEIKTALK